MKEQTEQLSQEIRNLESLTQDIQTFIQEDAVVRKAPLEVLLLLEKFQINYPTEYYRYKVYQLLPSLLQPAIQHAFATWNPLAVRTGVCFLSVECFEFRGTGRRCAVDYSDEGGRRERGIAFVQL